MVPGTGATPPGRHARLGTAGSAWDLDFSNDALQTLMFEVDGGNEQMQSWIARAGVILDEFGQPGHKRGQFTFLHSVTKDSKGNLYTGETINGRRIQKFDQVECNDGKGQGQRQRQLRLNDGLLAPVRLRSAIRAPCLPSASVLPPGRPDCDSTGCGDDMRHADFDGVVARPAAALRSVMRAHEFKLDAVMNAFVKIEANEAHLVIRAPLYRVQGRRKFPVKGTEIDVDECRRPR